MYCIGCPICLDVKSKDGRTALHQAALNCQSAVVELLIRHGADVNASDEDGFTPLQMATWTVKWGKDGADEVADVLRRNGGTEWTPESRARSVCHDGNLDVLTEIVKEHPAILRSRNGSGQSLLFQAATSGQLVIAQYLLNHGADIDETSASNWTPLMSAARYGHIDMVTFLLSQGADVLRDALVPGLDGSQRWDALEWAWDAGHRGEMIDILLSHRRATLDGRKKSDLSYSAVSATLGER